jgi:alkanesulfonate monooxygenase SsuD/methylene tetrahydromethanopterin reductase-like flavin-dependent oxidoreductase (luciferase family)
MRFGLFSTWSYRGCNEWSTHYQTLLEEVQYAETLGYETYWLSEHHGSGYGTIPTTSVVAATLLAATSKIRIGSAVVNLTFSNPVRIAEEWAYLDAISNGRVEFGVGRGYSPGEFALMGADPAISREVFSECLEIILGVWRNPVFGFKGKYFNFPETEIFPRCVQHPHPPVYVAALSPETFEIVGKHGLNILTTPALMGIEGLTKSITSAARHLVTEAGRTPESIDFPLQIIMHLAPTKTEAYQEAEEPLNWYFDRVLTKVPGGKGNAAKSYEFYQMIAEHTSAGAVSLDALNENGVAIIGTAEDAIRRLTELRDTINVKQVMLWMNFGGLAPDLIRRSMKIFAYEVMPHLQGTVTPVPDSFRVGSAPSRHGVLEAAA